MNNFPLYRKNTEILISVDLMATPRKRKEKERVSDPKRTEQVGPLLSSPFLSSLVGHCLMPLTRVVFIFNHSLHWLGRCFASLTGLMCLFLYPPPLSPSLLLLTVSLRLKGLFAAAAACRGGQNLSILSSSSTQSGLGQIEPWTPAAHLLSSAKVAPLNCCLENKKA